MVVHSLSLLQGLFRLQKLSTGSMDANKLFKRDVTTNWAKPNINCCCLWHVSVKLLLTFFTQSLQCMHCAEVWACVLLYNEVLGWITIKIVFSSIRIAYIDEGRCVSTWQSSSTRHCLHKFLDTTKRPSADKESFGYVWSKTSTCHHVIGWNLLKDDMEIWICCRCIHAVYLAWNSAVMWYLPAYWGNEGGDQVSAARAVILVASQVHSAVFPAVNQVFFFLLWMLRKTTPQNFIRDDVGQNLLRSKCLRVQPVPCWYLLVFLFRYIL